MAALLAAPGRGAALRTTGEVAAATFRDPLLRAVVTSQWGDYGLPPGQSAFAMHAVVATHYFGGAWYPLGGAGAIARTFLPVIEAAGGTCRVNHEAVEILVEGGRVAGVRALAREGGRAAEVTFRAPVVISDAGLAATHGRLLGREVPGGDRGGGTSCVTLYLGLSESPAPLGFRGENHWIYDTADHDAVWARRDDLLRGEAHAAYLSFPSLKDPAARAHTAEVVAFVDAGAFAPWRDRPWLRRGEEYDALKARMAGALLDLVERRHPGFRDLVAYQELSTPLTVEHFTGHAGGRIYGVPPTPERFREPAHGVRTPVRGLFLAGADAASLGVVGAFMGGALAAGAAMGPLGVQRVFTAAARQGAAVRGAGAGVREAPARSTLPGERSVGT
jgi:phytoene dehydrogenase-like protein